VLFVLKIESNFEKRKNQPKRGKTQYEEGSINSKSKFKQKRNGGPLILRML